jgi:hypothetical protein
VRRRGAGKACPGVSVVVPGGTEKWAVRFRKALLLEHAVQSLKPGVFEELMELMW